MATKKIEDAAAAKARKQKIILAVAGVLLVGLAAFQVPKLMSRGGSTAAAPATPAAGSGSSPVGAPVAQTPPVAAGSGSTATAVVVAGKTGAVVAGVALPVGAATKTAETGQLASFTLFDPKDPFVQKVSDQQTPAEKASDAYYNLHGTLPPAGSAAAGSGSGQSGADASGSGGAGSGGGAAPAQAPAPVAYATIDVDGKPQQVTLKDEFPSGTPLFVLRALKKGEAKIGVAGGSFNDGQTLTLKLGKKVTLVNTATGVRYVLKLAYTGAQPETLEGFTTAKQQGTTGAGGTTSSTGGATTGAGTTTTTTGN